MKTVKVEGQTLKIARVVEGASGKITAVLESGQEITYRPPAANAIREAFKLPPTRASAPATAAPSPAPKSSQSWHLFRKP